MTLLGCHSVPGPPDGTAPVFTGVFLCLLYFLGLLGLPRLWGFTPTSFWLGVPSSGLERLCAGTSTGFTLGLAMLFTSILVTEIIIPRP